MSNKLRILLCGANPYNANKGVVALATSAAILLDSIAEKNGIDIEICIYTHESNKVNDYIVLPNKKIRIKNIYPSNIFGLKNIFRTFSSRWRIYNLRELKKCDYIFNITAGDSFSDIYGVHNFNELNRINRLANKLKIPYLFLPQTYGPFFNKEAENAATSSLSRAKAIMSRDAQSTDFVKQKIGSTSVFDLIDLAFLLPYKKLDIKRSGINIGINVSETLWNISKNSNHPITSNYREIIREIITSQIEKGRIVHLIAHVCNSDNHPDNEYHLCYNLWKEFSHQNVVLAPLFLDAIEAKSYIADLDVFVGSRMHACIAAFSANIPVLPLSYSRKFSGLFVDTLHYNRLINLNEDVSAMRINSEIESLIEGNINIREQLANTNKTVVALSLGKTKDILTNIIKGCFQ